MEKTIKLKCPLDGAVLAVQWQPNIEKMHITCPICKKKRPFADYMQLNGQQKPLDDDATRYPGTNQGGQGANEPTHYGPTQQAKEETEIGTKPNYTLGKLQVSGLGQTFQLRPGKNLVGRSAEGSSASIKIPCPNKRMSREHIVIEVVKEPMKGFVHYLSLYKEKVNPTCVDGQPLEFGDRIVLQPGMVIQLPDVEARFFIPDEDATEI